MLKRFMILAGLIATVSITGCAKSGGEPAPPTGSPWAGHYFGTFVTSYGHSGSLDITIDASGGLAGRGKINEGSEDETISGSVATSGDASFTVNYSAGIATETGTLATGNDGHLKGTLTTPDGRTETIDLVKQ